MARIRAPELNGAGGWVGTSGPISLAALAGKIVVLDFWTSCCVNCLRVLEELRPIEQRFADEVVVIGVHSPKFPHEHDHDTVSRAVARHRITHPVLDDPELTTWQHYGIRAWPTVVVIDPAGYIVGAISGEGCGPVLTRTVEQLVSTHAADGTLRRGGHPWSAPLDPLAEARVLASPGKVSVDPSGEHLAVADTGHDRVLVLDPSGRVEHEILGLHAPQGVAFDGRIVVICDTGADRVITADLETGEQIVVDDEVIAPWDVAVAQPGTYVVAEAGRHRIWELRGGRRQVLAGTGQEALVDGSGPDALLAQPSGVCATEDGIVFVDAESSALRILSEGRVVTLVGQGLFDWGASDGGPESAALQHPLGVAAGTGSLYIADTFNSLVRAWSGPNLDPGAGWLRTVPLDGLCEPGGLDILADGRLIIADTGNHRLVIADPAAGTVTPVAVDPTWKGVVVGDSLEAVSGSTIVVPYDLDPGPFSLDDSAGPAVRLEVAATPGTLLGPGPRSWDLAEGHGALEVVAGRPGSGVLSIDVTVNVCDDDECRVLRARTRHDLEVAPAAPDPVLPAPDLAAAAPDPGPPDQ